MASWPATLPQKQFLGTTMVDGDAVLRTPNDAGPSSTRNRFTAIVEEHDTGMLLTGAQLQTLLTFHRTTLKHGALSFTWEDPVDDTTVTYKFRSPPKATLINGGTTSTRVYRVTMELEKQP